jgi:hypothetical protein
MKCGRLSQAEQVDEQVSVHAERERGQESRRFGAFEPNARWMWTATAIGTVTIIRLI